MNINDLAINSIIKSVVDYVRRFFSEAPFVVFKHGIILEVLPENKYSVKIQGAVYTVPCCTNQQFVVRDNVLMLSMQNNMNETFIIGKGSG